MQRISKLVRWAYPFLTLLLIAAATVSTDYLITELRNGSSKPSLAYDSPSRTDKPLFDGDLSYHGGTVLDGMTNVYLIFWIDASLQSPPPRYVSLIEQFITDVGSSPLYANLTQYHDANGHYPTGARLAGTFIDRHPFGSDLITTRDSSGQFGPIDSFIINLWEHKIHQVAAWQNWDTQDYHNLFVLLPVLNWGCAWHSYLSNGMTGQANAPYAVISYPLYQGQEQCANSSWSPNNDHVTDIAIDSLSHELMETVSDPYLDSWHAGTDLIGEEGQEMADKCNFIPAASINPKTKGNVTWNGHSYAIQEEYDNHRHGCVLAGP